MTSIVKPTFKRMNMSRKMQAKYYKKTNKQTNKQTNMQTEAFNRYLTCINILQKTLVVQVKSAVRATRSQTFLDIIFLM